MDIIERVTPESVGYRSEDVLAYIERLENCGTNMHGLMLARHGKVFAEGWWAPYSAQKRHGLQSLTKTYAVTAIGLLYDEGRIHLDDLVCEILKDHFPKEAGENAKKLTVRHVMTMHSGVRMITFATSATWIEDFFMAIQDEPGTTWCYSGMCTAILGALVHAITGEGIVEYLKPRLFDKIGIDSKDLKWITHRDGLEYCGGGLHAKTEDNLRLGLLYLNKGVFNGQRILSEEWVDMATSKQVENTNPLEPDSIDDHTSGYGYQVWRSHVPGNYMFWGAHGQYIQNMPKEDLCISMNQFIDLPGGLKPAKLELDIFDYGWEFGAKASDCALPENPAAYEILQNKLKSLAVPSNPCGPIPDESMKLCGKTYYCEQNRLSILPNVLGDERKYGVCVSYKLPKNIQMFSFEIEGQELRFDVMVNNKMHQVLFGLDGICRFTCLDLDNDLPNEIFGTAFFRDSNTLELYMRFIETCYENKWIITFGDNQNILFDEYALFTENGRLGEKITFKD